MRKLTHDEIKLIVNALSDKANGDRDAAQDGTRGVFPAEVDVLNTAAHALAETLRRQADVADDLANLFMDAEEVQVRS